MEQAIVVLMCSLEPGRKKGTVSWETARKARATMMVLWEASLDSGIDIVMSSVSMTEKYVRTCAPAK